MKRAHPEVDRRLHQLQGQIYAACGMGAWCFNEQQHLYMTTAAHQEEYLMLMQAGGCLELALGKKDEPGAPVILGGTFGLAWIVEWVHMPDGGRILIVLGPAYLKNVSMESTIERLDRMGVSQHVRQRYLNILRDVPVVSEETLGQYSAMLHFSCYEEFLNREELKNMEWAETATAQSALEDTGNSIDLQRMTEHESMMLDCLGRGIAPDLSRTGYQGELQDFHLKDGLRQIQDNLIIFTALCARHAATHGVPLRTAKELENRWICKIESMRSFSQGAKVMQEMYGAFLNQVRLYQQSTGLSRGVQECRDYIRANYNKSLTTEEIARHCGYTEYYLTRKFRKETGMKLTDYIRSVRLEKAKVMLLSSGRDVQQISEELQFGSRSYFDRVFRQEVGMSPRQFRETMGQGNQEDKG